MDFDGLEKEILGDFSDFEEDDDFNPDDFEEFDDWDSGDDWDLDDEDWEDFFSEDELEWAKDQLAQKRQKDTKSGSAAADADDEDEDGRRVLKASDVYEYDYETYLSYEEKGRYDTTEDEDDKQKMSRENLFFFADQDYFRSTRYEFMSAKNPGKGFVFGLFDPRPLDGDLDYSIDEIDGKTYLNSYESR